MKIKLALITIAAAVTVGGIFFAPKGQATEPAGTAATNVVVVDHEGDLVKGATIRITDAKGKELSRAETMAEGTVRPHFSADGTYSIKASLPKDFSPKEDTDGSVKNSTCTSDLLLCITVDVKGTDVRLKNAQLGLEQFDFTVTDETPEPRIEVQIIDVDNRKNRVIGGTLSITEGNDAAKVVYSEPNKSGNHTTGQLTAGNFIIRWSPSGTHGLAPGQTNPQVVQVGKKRLVTIFAKAVDVSSGSEIEPPERQTGATFRVRDIDTKQPVAGGSVKLSYIDQSGMYKQTEWANEGESIFIEYGSLIVHLSEVPENYELVSKVTVHTYDAGTTGDVFTVYVRDIKPPPTTTAPPEKAPEEETKDGDISVDPKLAEKISDCFMYLEDNPEFLELDPLLSTACAENVDFARAVISGLIAEYEL